MSDAWSKKYKPTVPTRRPVARIQRLLHEIPCLYGIKQRWSADQSVHIQQVDERYDFLDYCLCRDPSPNEKGLIHVHTVSDWQDRLVKVEIEGYGKSIFDALLELHRGGFEFAHIQHLVRVLPDGSIVVYRPHRNTSIKELFLKKCRSMPTEKVC